MLKIEMRNWQNYRLVIIDYKNCRVGAGKQWPYSAIILSSTSHEHIFKIVGQ